mgnify:CR=1 FL=1
MKAKKFPPRFARDVVRGNVALWFQPYVKGERPKTYNDWRAVFRKAVREGWLKLWFLDGQQYALTTAGQQAQRVQQNGGAA